MKILEKKSLFWDVEGIDPEKHKKFIIERILAFGDVDDFKWATEFYGKDELKKTFQESKKLDEKSANFWLHYFNIDKDKWEKNQSARKQSAFWNR